MSLPYRWVPDGTDFLGYTPKLEPGMLWPFEHAVYRVIEIRERPDREEKPWNVIVRPVDAPAEATSREVDRCLSIPRMFMWRVYPNEHYPICSKCSEPLPCRELMAEAASAAAAREFERYAAAAVCPACTELVSPRQLSREFSENLVVPGGPPVTFHLRRQCWSAAMEYEKRWVAAEPNRRRITMSCTGHVTNHNDGTSSCTEPGCPREQGQQTVWHPFVSNHFPGHSDCWCVTGALPDKPAEPVTPDHSAELRSMLDGDV